MEVKKTLLFKITVGFLLVIAPLVCLLFYITLHSMEVVRTQTARSNHNLLSSYLDQIDQTINKATNYLYNMRNAYNERLPEEIRYGTMEYILYKYKILKIYQSDSGLYPEVDFFLYHPGYNDFMTTGGGLDMRMKGEVRDRLEAIVAGSFPREWNLIRVGTGRYLAKMEPLNSQFQIGCLINLDRLIGPVDYIDLGERGFMTFVTESGEMLGSAANREAQLRLSGMDYNYRTSPYSLAKNDRGEKYLVVTQQSKWTDLYLLIAIPEENLLQSLHLLQQAVYAIPIILLIILVAYLSLLRRILIRPINSLIKGVRSVARGDWKVRVESEFDGEFGFLVHSFNTMVSEIKDLKIHVYEEKLKAEQAKFHHLQVQIKPHFYMNTLNIIYNLAALREYKSVQKLSLYLADYFRFITRTEREHITLAEELKHIRNYLDIQMLRFPDQLAYRIECPDEAGAGILPPLTVQTFVENCIVHGFQDSASLFEIVVCARTCSIGGQLTLEVVVADNGPGIPPETLAGLQTTRFPIDEEGRHLGIRNVHERLRMMFRSDTVLHFSNGETGGAVIAIRVPMQTTDDKR